MCDINRCVSLPRNLQCVSCCNLYVSAPLNVTFKDSVVVSSLVFLLGVLLFFCAYRFLICQSNVSMLLRVMYKSQIHPVFLIVTCII